MCARVRRVAPPHPRARDRRVALWTESSRSAVLACGMVWKLGKMWSVSSRIRLWRERYMVVRIGRAEFYKSDKEWRSGSIPLKVLGLKLCRATSKQGGQDAGKWVFYLEETACTTRCHVLAVESEEVRDKWLSLLHAAGDPGQAQALMQGVTASAARRVDGVRQEGGTHHHAPAHSQPQVSDACNWQVAQEDLEVLQCQSAHKLRCPDGNDGPAYTNHPSDSKLQDQHPLSNSAIHQHPELVDVSAASSTWTGGLVGADEETLAKFAQRWKLEAEKLTSLAQSSISSKVAKVTRLSRSFRTDSTLIETRAHLTLDRACCRPRPTEKYKSSSKIF